MNNRNGFTLIELLATIVIMALILLLVVPSITALRNNNEDKAYEYYGDSLVEASKIYVNKEGEDISPIGEVNWIGCVDITYENLIDADLIKPFSEENIDCSNATVRYTRTEDSSSYSYNLTCTDTDSNEVVYEHIELDNKECEVTAGNDTNPPECGTVIGGSTTWTNKSRTITVNCTDKEGSCKPVTKTYNQDNKFFRNDSITITDSSGNTNTCEVNVYVDKILPNFSGGIGIGEVDSNNKRLIIYDCSDIGSGCVKDFYDVTVSGSASSATISVEDKAGNIRTRTIELEPVEPDEPDEPDKNGWEWDDDDVCWYYYKDNKKLTGWQFIDNTWYYLDSDGCMHKGWLFENTTYPTCTSGWWYFNSSGVLMTGWQFIDGHWYYLAKGNSTEGKWSGSKPIGCMYTGWVYSEDYECETHGWYFNSSGQMLSNTTVDGYTLDANGCWVNSQTVTPNNCKVRGNSILSGLFPWVCDEGHTHTTGYSHYCSDANGKIITYADNPTLVKYKYVCPTGPYGSADGWTVIND